MLEIVELAPCPLCGGAPEFIERELPTGLHMSCKFVCATKCGFRSPGVAQRLDLPGSRDLHRAWGRTNAAKQWNLSATPSAAPVC
jgi:hypothetical protein